MNCIYNFQRTVVIKFTAWFNIQNTDVLPAHYAYTARLIRRTNTN
jgi:hypothetical protein